MNQTDRMFLHEDLAIKVIMNCRIDNSSNCKISLVFRLHDVINTKQEKITWSIKEAFEGEYIQSEYCVLRYRINLYFHDLKLAIKVDEFDHCDRDSDDKEDRDKELKKELGCKFIRINPDEENFNINKAIN